MIEESYVSFDTAKLLKEAGFREHCRCSIVHFSSKRWAYLDDLLPERKEKSEKTL